jgi:hypothetical protein
MNNYQYKLDPSPRKYTCPSCGQKRFVRYINTRTGALMPAEIGRCDREQSCSYHKLPDTETAACYVSFDFIHDYSPKAYEITMGTRRHFIPKSAVLQLDQKGAYVKAAFLKNKNSKIPYKEIDTKHFDKMNNSVATPLPVCQQPAISFIPQNIMLPTLSDLKDNILINFLLTHFKHEQVIETASKYRIGTTSNGNTIFWQIDNQQMIHSGKIMAYDTMGHRLKNKPPDWIHSKLKLPDFNLQQCLFGLHLLPEAKSANVCIVESEKTALIASICFPDKLWLATGGSTNLQAEKLEPLRDKQIILFPDLGAFNKWSEKAIQLNKMSFRIKVSPFLEEKASAEDWERGLDLADYLITMSALNENDENNETLPKHLLFELSNEIHHLNVDWFRNLQNFPSNIFVKDGDNNTPIHLFIRNQVANIKKNNCELSYDKLCWLQHKLLTLNIL